MSKPAPDDAKGAISQQLIVAEEFGKSGGLGTSAAYVETNRIKNDVQQYEPWSWSWGPIAAGGWFSSEDILKRADKVLARIADTGYKPVASDARVARGTPAAIYCNAECQEKANKDRCYLLAQELFGTTAAMVPGAGDLACKFGKTGLYLTIGLVGVAVLVGGALILRPYASLASMALAKKPKKRNKK